ncbi:hypothetical protein F183_A42440 [Bryobacterales bacterium F-183]|nr:hypothetical protein F183_A42440 [Bryobacterales bacterium F-183]
MSQAWRDDGFVWAVAAKHGGWTCRQTGERRYVIEGECAAGAWNCRVEQDWTSEDGTSAEAEWCCPAFAVTEAQVREVLDSLRVGGTSGVRLPVPLFDVQERTAQGFLRSLFSRPSEPELRVDDSAGIVDDGLRARLQGFPQAYNQAGRLQQVRLGRAITGPAGLLVRTVDWWGSEAVLSHQIELGIEIAVRLRAAMGG